jgi:hypothetical protein
VVEVESVTANSTVIWTPQEGPQDTFIRCPALEAFYGGSVGGGKSDALLGDYSRGCELGSGWVGVLFRRNFPDMDDIIRRSHEIFGPVYGSKCYSASKYQWNFPSGAILQFRSLEKDTDVYKYQGQQYSWIGFDELTQWPTPFCYTYLFSRLRSAKGMKVRMRCASNPGGPGHAWVKQRFLDPMPQNTGLRVTTKSGGAYWRVFIRARLEDNKILMDNDPGYGDRVYEVHDPVLAHALRTGDWNILAGAAFPEFDTRLHVIDNAPMPQERPIRRSMDWGFKTPYGCTWGFAYDGDLIIGGELYGWSGTPNVGTEESPEEVKRKIANFEAMNEIYVPVGLLDNQCWAEHGYKSEIVRLLSSEGPHDMNPLSWKPWEKGKYSRIQQNQLLHGLMSSTNGRTRFKVMRRCVHTIRTFPLLQRDQNNPEDVDTRCEDHLYDATRALAAAGVPTREQLRGRALRRNMAPRTRGSDLTGGNY